MMPPQRSSGPDFSPDLLSRVPLPRQEEPKSRIVATLLAQVRLSSDTVCLDTVGTWQCRTVTEPFFCNAWMLPTWHAAIFASLLP